MHRGELRFQFPGSGLGGINDVQLADGIPNKIAAGRYRMTFEAKDWVNTGEVPWSPQRIAALEKELLSRGVRAKVEGVRTGKFSTHGGLLREDDYYANFTFDIDIEVFGPTKAVGLGIEPISTSIVIIVVCVAAVIVAGITLLSIKELGPAAASVVAGSAGLVGLAVVSLVGVYFYNKYKKGG